MTDEELQTSWPAFSEQLNVVVTELRRREHSALADRLVSAVRGASTSGEIYSGVGNALQEHRALRNELSPAAAQAWRRVMTDVGRAFGRPPFREWVIGVWHEKLNWAAIVQISLAAAAYLGLVGSGAFWILLMERINRAPRAPTLEQTVPYMRHGSTVYIAPVDDALLTWLPVAGAVFGIGVFLTSLWLRMAYAKAVK